MSDVASQFLTPEEAEEQERAELLVALNFAAIQLKQLIADDEKFRYPTRSTVSNWANFGIEDAFLKHPNGAREVCLKVYQHLDKWVEGYRHKGIAWLTNQRSPNFGTVTAFAIMGNISPALLPYATATLMAHFAVDQAFQILNEKVTSSSDFRVPGQNKLNEIKQALTAAVSMIENVTKPQQKDGATWVQNAMHNRATGIME